jgi:large subunit ribosomal protein L35
MPKIKTHRGTAKRVRLTPSGKLVRRKANQGHFLQKKSASRKRSIMTKTTVKGSLVQNLKKALGALK